METTEISQGWATAPTTWPTRQEKARATHNLPDTEQLFVFLYIEFYLPMQQSVQPESGAHHRTTSSPTEQDEQPVEQVATVA
jgi:hypothetical protein